MSAIVDHPHRHPITAEEFLRMDEAGVFAPEARLELIEGEIIEMAPIKPPHAGLVIQLSELLGRSAGERALLSVQGPVVLSDRSVLQPDLALLRRRADFYKGALPLVPDVLLLIEVSDSSLSYDLEAKVPLYARREITEAWVVDINGRAIHVFRQPAEGAYRSAFVARGSDRVTCLAITEVAVHVSELFPA